MDQKGGSVSTLPLYDQGNSNLCYAYTAAELIDAYRASHGGTKDQLTSIAHVAALYHATLDTPNYLKMLDDQLAQDLKDSQDPKQNALDRRIHDHLRDGYLKSLTNPDDRNATDAVLDKGNVTQTLSLARKKGQLCNQDLFASGEAGAATTLKPLLELRQAILRSARPENFREQLGCELLSTFGDSMKGQMANLAAISDHILKSVHNKKDFVLSAIENSCASKISTSQLPPPQEVKFDNADSAAQEFPQKLAELLSRPNSQPVAIEFDGAILTGSSSHYSHAVIVVGQELKDGVCQVIIRNSFGNCRPPHDYESYQYPCKDGQLSIPRDDFAKTVHSMTWL